MRKSQYDERTCSRKLLRLLRDRSCTDSFLAPSNKPGTSFGGVLDRIEATDYTENGEDVQVVSELTDDVRDAVINYLVSGGLKPFPLDSSFRQAV